MASPDVNYRSLTEDNHFTKYDATNSEAQNENEDTPRNSGIMIHIVPETSKARWNHIEDLDSFFSRMYLYHQKHGFTVILMDEVFQLLEFGFVVWLLTFTIHCIDHPILFGNKLPQDNHTKITLNDVIIPMGKCVQNFGSLTYLVLVLTTFYFMYRLIKMIYHITQYSDIKKFYNTALHVEDSELDNITWHEIKKKIREVQAEQHMCIDKEQLTELDIYHRILRFKNYMVALMNKNLLPVRFNVPVLGEFVSLSRGLLLNIEIILFRGPGSPFQNNWQLRDEYTVRSNQIEVAQRLSRLIMGVAILNFVLAPIIFLWQIIYFSFAYANVLRKEPGALGMRTWSNYGRLYLRHFNELDHELDARLNRAYEYADKYLSSFSSPFMAVIAKNILFITGGLLVLILALGIYEEHVFQVEHVLAIITALSVIGLICRSQIPDENLVWCPEQLMTAILAHVHYLPTNWKNEAHTTRVRKEFGNFFQFKAAYLFNEICSPLITPFVLMFVFRPKALEIVKFFRSFTVTVKGVGNVCSFAQMDIRKHGSPAWQLQQSATTRNNNNEEVKKEDVVEHGKTELSLIRFTLTNPDWQMPQESKNFVMGIRENARLDLLKTKNDVNAMQPNPLTESLMSFGTIGEEYSSIVASVLYQNPNAIPTSNSMLVSNFPQRRVFNHAGASGFEQMLQHNLGDESHDQIAQDTLDQSQIMYASLNPAEKLRRLRTCKVEGSLEGPTDALLYSISGRDPKTLPFATDLTVADMCLSALYMHELYKKNRGHVPATNVDDVPGTSRQQSSHAIISAKAAENTPLLGNIRS